MSIEKKREELRSKLNATQEVWQRDLDEKNMRLQEQYEILRSPEAQTDRRENAVYQTAIETVRLLGIEIKSIESKITAFSQFIGEAYTSDGTVQLGSTVVIELLETNTSFDVYIVPADLGQARIGAISTRSPVGKGLIGRRAGETIAVETLQGLIHYRVKEVY